MIPIFIKMIRKIACLVIVLTHKLSIQFLNILIKKIACWRFKSENPILISFEMSGLTHCMHLWPLQDKPSLSKFMLYVDHASVIVNSGGMNDLKKRKYIWIHLTTKLKKSSKHGTTNNTNFNKNLNKYKVSISKF